MRAAILAALIGLLCAGCPGAAPGTGEGPIRPPWETGGLPILELDSRPQALDGLFEKVDALRRKKAGEPVRIAHFGDSHTAADLLTGRVRTLLQGRFGDAGRGFLLFGKPWAGYWPSRAETGQSEGWTGSNALFIGIAGMESSHGVYGLGGGALCTAEADREAWILLADPGELAGTVYFANQPGGGTFVLETGGADPVRISTRTAEKSLGSRPWRMADGAARELRVRTQGDGPVCLLGATVERPGPGLVYDSLGLNGARLTHLGEWDPWVTPMLADRSYDLLVLSYGSNEAEDDWLDLDDYARRGDDALERLRAALPRADCLLVGAPPSGRPGEGGPRFHERLLQIRAVQRELAAKHGCAWFDTLRWMGGPKAFADWMENPTAIVLALANGYDLATAHALLYRGGPTPLFAGDAVHLTPSGYDLVADLLYGAFMRSYYRHLMDRFRRAPARPGN
jgi:lysophospholipase L1-like esterase